MMVVDITLSLISLKLHNENCIIKGRRRQKLYKYHTKWKYNMYIVEGNIGVGKSTFLNLLKNGCSKIETIQEPVSTWDKNVSGESVLGNFYKNPTRWAYTIETLAMIYRTRDYAKEQKNANPNRVMERSVYSGHYCFAYNSLKSGFLNSAEWAIYQKWVDFLLRDQCKPPLGFIYLKSTPETCFQRVKKRNRASEKNLTIETLKKIHEFHERFLVQKKDIFEELKNTPVLILNCNKNFLENDMVMHEKTNKVLRFFKETQRL
jgi:deoxyadenosine/deoxycytidine kinase